MESNVVRIPTQEESAMYRTLAAGGMPPEKISKIKNMMDEKYQEEQKAERIHMGMVDFGVIDKSGKPVKKTDETAQTKQREKKYFSMKALDAEKPAPVEHIIKNMVPVGLSTISAPPKSFKSWSCLDMAVSVANGKPFLGHETKKCKVMYYALEDDKSNLYERQQIYLCGDEPLDDVFMQIELPTTDEGLFDELEWMLQEEPEVRFVIIDTYGMVQSDPKKGANPRRHEYKEAARFREFADRHKIAILLVHHNNKMVNHGGDIMNSISGTNGLPAACDSVIQLWKNDREDEEANMYVYGRKVRNSKTVIRFDTVICRWQMVGNVDDVKALAASRAYENEPVVITIKALLHDAPYTWTGTATQLFNECIARTGFKPSETEATLIKKVKSINQMLFNRDKIIYRNHQIKGQHMHTFSKLEINYPEKK